MRPFPSIVKAALAGIAGSASVAAAAAILRFTVFSTKDYDWNDLVTNRYKRVTLLGAAFMFVICSGASLAKSRKDS